MLSSLFGRIEEKRTKEWDPHAVAQYDQIGLRELERSRILVHQLPHAVQEEHEQWGLNQEIREGGKTKQK